MKKHILTLAVLALVCGSASAQGLLGRLGERAKQAVENNIGNKIEEGVNNVLNGNKKGGKDAKNQKTEETESPAEASGIRTARGEAVKSDFVPGTVVIFEDNLAGEQMGEFPSKWDLMENNAEVARMNGRMAIRFEHGADTKITPLVEDGNRQYLPEVFTLEFDYFITGEEGHDSHYRINFLANDHN